MSQLLFPKGLTPKEELTSVLIVPMAAGVVKPYVQLMETKAGLPVHHLDEEDGTKSVATLKKLADKVSSQNIKHDLGVGVPRVKRLYMHVDLTGTEALGHNLLEWFDVVFQGPKTEAGMPILNLLITIRDEDKPDSATQATFPSGVGYTPNPVALPKDPDKKPYEVGLKEMKDMISRKDWAENEDRFKHFLTDNVYEGQEADLVLPH